MKNIVESKTNRNTDVKKNNDSIITNIDNQENSLNGKMAIAINKEKADIPIEKIQQENQRLTNELIIKKQSIEKPQNHTRFCVYFLPSYDDLLSYSLSVLKLYLIPGYILSVCF